MAARSERLRVRGHRSAAAAALDLVASGRAHAVILAGPARVGKTTLALDLAAVLLCTAEPAARPCRACRGCRMVESGNHPDLHRLAPDGPGAQIRIGARSDPEPGTVRRLVADLALLPVEGGARVALIEHADRLNEDAQSALLKTLEEPPPGLVLLLCADEEERLLPTVRSRCARVRLGPVGTREIEELLGASGVADAPTAARLGRLAAGRPGTALAYARAPTAVVRRGEIARTLLDLLGAPRSTRLTSVRGLLVTAGEIVEALAGPGSDDADVSRRPGRASGRRARAGTGLPTAAVAEDPEAAPGGPSTARRPPVAERRRAALLLVDMWRDLARDLALVQLGELRRLRDPGLLDDLLGAAGTLAPGAAAAFLSRLDRAGELLEANVGPELVADALALAWPHTGAPEGAT